MVKRTLIAYETYYGSTKHAASEIAKILENEHNHQVLVHNIGKDYECPDLTDFDNVIIGSCVYNGKWGGHADHFLKNNFDKKKVALFVCSMFAGDKKLYGQAYQSYLETKLENNKHIKPVSMEAFGGKVPKTGYPDQWLKTVVNRLPEFTTDNRSLRTVRKWAHVLGKKFE